MVRLVGSTVVRPVDVRGLAAVIPELAERWRGLRFDGNLYVDDDGRRREGLRVVHGVHPRPDARYQVVLDSYDERATVRVGLVADNLAQLHLRVEADEVEVAVGVDVRHPAQPDQIEVDVVGEAPDSWFTRGRFVVSSRLDLSRLPSAGHPMPQLVADLEHRRVRASATVSVGATNEGWALAVELKASGRGVLRPLVWLAGPVAALVLRRRLAALLAQVPAQVDALNEALVSGPEDLAAELLDNFLAGVPERL